MRKPRVSVGGLMALIVLASVGLAAMRSPTVLWASALFTLAVALFSTATLGAAFDRRSARAGWAGVALFGWVYLVTAFGFVAEGNGVAAPPFLTHALSDYMGQPSPAGTPVRWQNSLPLGEPILALAGGANANTPGGPILDRRDERRVCHSLGAVAFALLGGIAARVLAARNDEAGGPRPPTG